MTDRTPAFRTLFPAALITIFGVGIASCPAESAEVKLQLSNEKTYVGLPVTLRIEIRDSSYHNPPDLKEVDGLKIRQAGPPSSSSNIQIVQDASGIRKTNRSTITYSFNVTPQRAGTFTIAPIRVSADGVATVTKAITIEAAESETGDLLLLEVDAKQDSVYVGQRLEITLRVLIKRYIDERYGVRLSKSNMWRLVRTESEWGIFADRIEEIQQARQLPRAPVVVREGTDGEPAEYFSFEIDATIYPTRPGKIDGQEINVFVHYPVRIGEAEDPFGDFPANRMMREMFRGSVFAPRLEISQVRPVAATATVSAVEVRPIPTVGRPDQFQGAVGQFQIVTDTPATSCSVGDPIHLLIAIDGSGPLEGISAPDIANLPDLTKDFKVVDEPLGGYVDGTRKVFSTTIRPKHDRVTSIPSIPYTYFDPTAEEFVTTKSDPISISVQKSEVLSLGDLAGGAPDADATSEPERSAATSSVDQETWQAAELLEDQKPAKFLTLPLIILLTAPPILAVVSQLFLRRAWMLAFLRQFTPADREFVRRLHQADDRESVADALQRYLGRITGVSDRLSALGVLRWRGSGQAAIAAERVYAKCDADFLVSGNKGEHISKLKEEAKKIAQHIHDSDSDRRSVDPSRAGRLIRRSATMIAWSVLSMCTTENSSAQSTSDGRGGISLSRSQAMVLLNEAQELLGGAERAPGDGENKIEQFANAADSFHTVIESGVSNAELHFLAGRAFQGAGKSGRAAAEFRRALRLNPDHHRARRALFRTWPVEEEDDRDGGTIIDDASFLLSRWNERVASVVPMKALFGVSVLAWIGLWTAIALRWSAVAKSSWLAPVFLAAVALSTGWVYLDARFKSTRTGRAVLTAELVQIHTSDDASQPIVATLTNAEGRVVQELARRAGWVRIQTKSGTGWVRDSALRSI